MQQELTALVQCKKGAKEGSGVVEMLVDVCRVTIQFTGENSAGTAKTVTDNLMECYRQRVKKWMV